MTCYLCRCEISDKLIDTHLKLVAVSEGLANRKAIKLVEDKQPTVSDRPDLTKREREINTLYKDQTRNATATYAGLIDEPCLLDYSLG